MGQALNLGSGFYGAGFGIQILMDMTGDFILAVGATSAVMMGAIEFDSAGGYLAIGVEETGWNAPGTLVLFHSADGRRWTDSVEEVTHGVAGGLTTSYVNGRWRVDIMVADQQVGNASTSTWNAHLETLTSSDGVAWSWEQPSTEFRSSPIEYGVQVRHGSETIGLGASSASGAGTTLAPTGSVEPTGPWLAPTQAVLSPEPSATPSAQASSPIALDHRVRADDRLQQLDRRRCGPKRGSDRCRGDIGWASGVRIQVERRRLPGMGRGLERSLALTAYPALPRAERGVTSVARVDLASMAR